MQRRIPKRILRIRVGPRLQQQLNGAVLPLCCGQMQRRAAVVVPGGGAAAGFQQQGHESPIPALGSHMQRSAGKRAPGVRAGSGGQQQASRGRIPAASRFVQRGVALPVAALSRGPRLQQQRRAARVPALHGPRQRRLPGARLDPRVRLGAGLQQQADTVLPTVRSRRHQRGGPGSLLRISGLRVRPSVQRSAKRLRIAGCGRRQQGGIRPMLPRTFVSREAGLVPRPLLSPPLEQQAGGCILPGLPRQMQRGGAVAVAHLHVGTGIQQQAQQGQVAQACRDMQSRVPVAIASRRIGAARQQDLHLLAESGHRLIGLPLILRSAQEGKQRRVSVLVHGIGLRPRLQEQACTGRVVSPVERGIAELIHQTGIAAAVEQQAHHFSVGGQMQG